MIYHQMISCFLFTVYSVDFINECNFRIVMKYLKIKVVNIRNLVIIYLVEPILLQEDVTPP